MFKRLFGQRKYLSAITAGILVIQTFLPSAWGVPKVFAEDGLTYTLSFDDAADYTTDSNIAIGQDLMYFKTTWNPTTDGTELGGANDPVIDLVPDSSGTIWAVLNGGDVYYSEDSGATWTIKAITGITNTLEIAEVTYATTPGVDLVAVGETVSYSSDGGANWTGATLPVMAPTTYVAVSASSANGVAYVVTSDNPAKVLVTSDGGANWALTGQQPGTIASAIDIAWISSNIVVLVGNDGGTGGVLEYSMNPALIPWATKDLPDTEPLLTEVDYINGKIYVAGASGALDGVYIAVSTDFNPSGAWTNQSSDLVADYDLVYISDLLGNSNIPFFVGAGGDRKSAVFCSFDSGATWLEQSNTAHDDLGIAQWSALAIQPTTNWLLMGGALGGKTDIFLGKYSLASSSIVATTPIYNAVKITALSVTEHSLSNGEAKFAFSRQSTDAGEWYYYDTGASAWTADASADDSSKANTMAELTEVVLGTMLDTIPATDSALYVKIYSQNATGQMLIADSVTITYNTAVLGGGGGGTDETRPTSNINPLPRYTTVADACNPTLHVTATATDDSSGVKRVTLYVATDDDKMPTSSFGTLYYGEGVDPEWETVGWEVPVDDGKTYYFGTAAADNAGNYELKFTSKQDSYGNWIISGWSPPTTVYVYSPYLVESKPAEGEGSWPTGQPVSLEFSEYMDPGSLTYNFYSAEGEVPSSVVWSDKNEDETGAKIATITPTSNDGILLELTRYNFRIKTATDLAGNRIVDVDTHYTCELQDEIRSPLLFSFTTAKEPHPNLTSSKLQVALGSHNGKYAVGEEVEYTLYLHNTDKTVDAPSVTVTIIFVDGISYVSDNSKGGLFRKLENKGKIIGLEWTGSVLRDSVVEPKFTMRVGVDGYAAQLTVEQNMTLNDGINGDFTPSQPAIFNIVPDSLFTTSEKESNRTETVAPGAVVTYTVTIYNTGSTVGDVAISDLVPRHYDSAYDTPEFYYSDPSIDTDDKRWLDESPSWDKDTETITGFAQGIQKNDPPLVFTFKAVIRDVTEKKDVTNTAYVWDPNIGSDEQTSLTSSIHVSPTAEKDPLQVVSQSPAPNSENNGFKQSIIVGFNYPVDPEQFEFSLSNELGSDTTTWGQAWDETNTIFTLTAPTDDPLYDGFPGELAVGSTYTVTIISAVSSEETVEPLENPVTWQFTTADPWVRITYPFSKTNEIRTNTLSDLYTVTLWDTISDRPYIAEEDITLNVSASFGIHSRDSGKFWKRDNNNNLVTFNAGNPLVVPEGANEAAFYYKDSEITPIPLIPSDPWCVTILVADSWPVNQDRGWSDDQTFVTVVDTEQPLQSLVINLPSTPINVNKFSAPIRITAKDAEDRSEFLPKGNIYFYSGRITGAFYDASQRKLPYLITAQEESTEVVPQYILSDGSKSSITVYYLDSQSGKNIMVVADNSIYEPDTGFNDAVAFLNVEEKLEEEELLEELEEVIDDTGRVIDKMVIKPVEAQMLPGKTQLFKATAYDTEGKPIDNAKFKWFVLIDQSGTIKKDGDDKTTHRSTFTAGEELGTYYDTILVATLYNGKIGYATASVAVVDVVDYKGPQRLPVTGMNGLQLVLMGLTLLAAVALAWVEHYDKTHFKATK